MKRRKSGHPVVQRDPSNPGEYKPIHQTKENVLVSFEDVKKLSPEELDKAFFHELVRGFVMRDHYFLMNSPGNFLLTEDQLDELVEALTPILYYDSESSDLTPRVNKILGEKLGNTFQTRSLLTGRPVSYDSGNDILYSVEYFQLLPALNKLCSPKFIRSEIANNAVIDAKTRVRIRQLKSRELEELVSHIHEVRKDYAAVYRNLRNPSGVVMSIEAEGFFIPLLGDRLAIDAQMNPISELSPADIVYAITQKCWSYEEYLKPFFEKLGKAILDAFVEKHVKGTSVLDSFEKVEQALRGQASERRAEVKDEPLIKGQSVDPMNHRSPARAQPGR